MHTTAGKRLILFDETQIDARQVDAVDRVDGRVKKAPTPIDGVWWIRRRQLHPLLFDLDEI